MGLPRNLEMTLPGGEPAGLAEVLQFALDGLKRAIRQDGQCERKGAFLIGPLRLTAVLSDLQFSSTDIRNLSAILQHAGLAIKTSERQSGQSGITVWAIRATRDVAETYPSAVLEAFLRETRVEEELREKVRTLGQRLETLSGELASKVSLDEAFVEEIIAEAQKVVNERNQLLRSNAGLRGENTKLRKEVQDLSQRVQSLSRTDREITRQAALERLRAIIAEPARETDGSYDPQPDPTTE